MVYLLPRCTGLTAYRVEFSVGSIEIVAWHIELETLASVPIYYYLREWPARAFCIHLFQTHSQLNSVPLYLLL
jgi:hypothetical protein